MSHVSYERYAESLSDDELAREIDFASDRPAGPMLAALVAERDRRATRADA